MGSRLTRSLAFTAMLSGHRLSANGEVTDRASHKAGHSCDYLFSCNHHKPPSLNVVATSMNHTNVSVVLTEQGSFKHAQPAASRIQAMVNLRQKAGVGTLSIAANTRALVFSSEVLHMAGGSTCPVPT